MTRSDSVTDGAIAFTRILFGAYSTAIERVRRIGRPWIDAWLERETSASSLRYFPLFGVFVVCLVLGLYRSWRALAAILISLAVAVYPAVKAAHVKPVDALRYT